MPVRADTVAERAVAASTAVEHVRASLQAQRDAVLGAVVAVLIPSADRAVLERARDLLEAPSLDADRLLALIEPRRAQLVSRFTGLDDAADDLDLPALVAMRAGLLAARDGVLFDLDQRRAQLAGAPTSSIATIDQHETQVWGRDAALVAAAAPPSLVDESLASLEATLLELSSELAHNARLLRLRREAEDGLALLDDAVIADARSIANDVIVDWLREPQGAHRFDTDIAPHIIRLDDTALGVLRATRGLSSAMRVVDELRRVLVEPVLRRAVRDGEAALRQLTRAELLARAALAPVDWASIHESQSVWHAVFATVDDGFSGPGEEDDRSGAFLPAVVAEHLADITNVLGDDVWQAPSLTGPAEHPSEGEANRALRAGGRLGRYLIERRLGGGGMRDVYAAVQDGPRGFAKRVVVKCIRTVHADDPTFINLFQREASLVARLSHPCVVAVLDVGVVGGRWYMAVEFIDGVPGLVLVPESPLVGRAPRPTAGIIARAIADAAAGLAHAHERGVVHRDVSPDNLMLQRSGRTKIIDFGVASVIGDAGSESDDALMGKVSYMAPEVPLGGGVTPACDVWGLGITLHQIATGRRPFDAANHAATILRITGEQIDLAALRLESELRELITAMLDKDPAARPSALEVSVALERLAAPDTDVARWVAQLPAPPR